MKIIGMYHFNQTDAGAIPDCFNDVLLRCDLPLDDCRWQAYDGAATMSDHLSGVTAMIKAEYPAAHHIHCANHRVDLALDGCAKENTSCTSPLYLFKTLQFSYEIPKDHVNLRRYCQRSKCRLVS